MSHVFPPLSSPRLFPVTTLIRATAFSLRNPHTPTGQKLLLHALQSILYTTARRSLSRIILTLVAFWNPPVTSRQSWPRPTCPSWPGPAPSAHPLPYRPQTPGHLSGPRPPYTCLCHSYCSLGLECSFPRSSDVCPTPYHSFCCLNDSSFKIQSPCHLQ